MLQSCKIVQIPPDRVAKLTKRRGPVTYKLQVTDVYLGAMPSSLFSKDRFLESLPFRAQNSMTRSLAKPARSCPSQGSRIRI